MRPDYPSTEDIARAVSTLGSREGLFWSGEVRRALNVRDRVLSARICNRIKDFEKIGAIELVSTGKKRYKYYRVAEEQKLRRYFAPISVASAPALETPQATPTVGVVGLAEVAKVLHELRETALSVAARIEELQRKLQH